MRHVTMASRRTAAESLTRMLLQAGKGARKDLLGAFSGEALDAAGARRDAPPFAVVSSTTMDLSVGRWGSWPSGLQPCCFTQGALLRQGTCECARKWLQHSWEYTVQAGQTAVKCSPSRCMHEPAVAAVLGLLCGFLGGVETSVCLARR